MQQKNDFAKKMLYFQIESKIYTLLIEQNTMINYYYISRYFNYSMYFLRNA